MCLTSSGTFLREWPSQIWWILLAMASLCVCIGCRLRGLIWTDPPLVGGGGPCPPKTFRLDEMLIRGGLQCIGPNDRTTLHTYTWNKYLSLQWLLVETAAEVSLSLPPEHTYRISWIRGQKVSTATPKNASCSNLEVGSNFPYFFMKKTSSFKQNWIRFS